MPCSVVQQYSQEPACSPGRITQPRDFSVVRAVRQGYIGSPSFLRAVMGVYRTLKSANPGMLFICDPVRACCRFRVRFCCASSRVKKETRLKPVR